ncbi:hypothetical protein VTJ04DRAFT_10881 [Mycothermus thermophilus]|uniref:uncharacterized protein n=1 Tax=Humicola insolens TaxID=85995 RepID=UPI0037445C54
MNTDVSGLLALQSFSVMLNRLRQWRTRFGIHSRELGDPERDFISKFGTIMMPVQGLYDWLDAGALFHDSTYTDNCLETLLNIHQRVSLTLMARESQTFIAIVGSSYRGCNLQMSDLEFLSADEVEKAYQAAVSKMMFGKRLLKASGKRRLELPTALELDVFSMRSLWNAWDAHARAVSHWAEVPVRRPRLQFARIKEEAFARLKVEYMYYKDWDIENWG